MKLPDQIELRAIEFSDGMGGWSQQKFRDDKHNITVVSTRESRGKPFLQKYFVDSLPDKSFNSYRELRNYVEGQECI